MIGLSIIFGLTCYVLLARFITKLVFKKTKRLLYKRLAIAFFILLPTWDVIIGFPLYWYLCKFHSGMEIYKTVDDVQGFYVGEKYKKWQPIMPEKGYEYVDYKLTGTDQYYRSTWLNDNTHEDCYLPTRKAGKYRKAFEAGRCLIVDPISFDSVSRYEVTFPGSANSGQESIFFLTIVKFVSIEIVDRKSGSTISSLINYKWNQGWVVSTFFSFSGPSWTMCDKSNDIDNIILKTLKK